MVNSVQIVGDDLVDAACNHHIADSTPGSYFVDIAADDAHMLLDERQGFPASYYVYRVDRRAGVMAGQTYIAITLERADGVSYDIDDLSASVVDDGGEVSADDLE